MAKVGLRDVRKSYGELEVIHGVTTDVADGIATLRMPYPETDGGRA